jgi:type II secretory ATPase GspE/PulE/Tfp pilus assembly ATPase PilB-like protein
MLPVSEGGNMPAKKPSRSARRPARNAAGRMPGSGSKVPTVIDWVNRMLIRASRDWAASEIHLRSTGTGVTVLFRMDGELRRVEGPPGDIEFAAIERVKRMARLTPTEECVARESRFGSIIDGREVDYRVSVVPTGYGEKVVLKLSDRSRFLPLDKLGLSAGDLKAVRSLNALPRGLVLVAAPAGSGTLTTLYAMLDELSRQKRRIVTIEKSVEFKLDGVSQLQLNPATGLTDEAALLDALGRSPEVLMVGELASKEVATAALDAALGGRLVFSSIRAQDASEALHRLTAMGVEPDRLAAGLAGIIAQRLLRVICPDCKHTHEPDPVFRSELKVKRTQNVYEGRGCAECGHTGFRGRVGAFEVLPATEGLRKLIARNADETALRAFACKSGMHPLVRDGIARALAGVTTLEQVWESCWALVSSRPWEKFSK